MTEEQLQDRKKVLDACEDYQKAMINLKYAELHLSLSLSNLALDSVEGLGWFVHYRNHLIEMHRLLTAAFDRRWGVLWKEYQDHKAESEDKEAEIKS